MDLNRDDQDHARFPLAGFPPGTTPVVKVGDYDWRDLEPSPTDGDDWWRVLVRGPDYEDDTLGLLLTADYTPVRARAKNSPVSKSIVVGQIRLVDPTLQ